MTGSKDFLKLAASLSALFVLSSVLPTANTRAADGDSPDSVATSSADAAAGSSDAAADPSKAGNAAKPDTDSTPAQSSNKSADGASPGSISSVRPPSATEQTRPPASSVKPVQQSASQAKAPAPAPSGKPLVLTGRIEELCKGNSATLPLQWKKMEPVRDTSLDSKPIAGKTSTTTLAAAAQQKAYPMDFRGTWSGTLTIFSRAFAPSRWQFDAAEADKEYKIMTPGRQGQTTITFYQRGNGTYMEPCQVVFSGTTSMSEMSQSLNKMYGMNSQQAAMFGNMQVPVMYALHLGNLSAGTGVTGNQLQSRLMKNDIKQLRPDIIEQQVVTQDSDRNPQTGKTRLSYSESVLRFTRIDSNRLYLQAAAVNYQNDGKFSDKVVLYGTLNRGAGGAAGYPANPLNPFAAGAGGAGNMMDAMKQLQQMMQQMQR